MGHKKRNKQVGTVVGAVLGGSIGADIARKNRHRAYDDYAYTNQEVCRVVSNYREENRIAGYWVTYRYRGYTSTTQLSYHPGERMPVNVSLSPLP